MSDKVPPYENDQQWLRYLESERLRIGREIGSGNLSPSQKRVRELELMDIDKDIEIVRERIRQETQK